MASKVNFYSVNSPTAAVHPREFRLRLSIVVRLILLGSVPAISISCEATRPLHLKITEAVQLPNRPIIVFLADGVNRRLFDEWLEAGRLPNIRRFLLDRGVSVERAIASAPSLTYPNIVSLETGVWPGRHEVVGNAWYERSTGTFQSYMKYRTFRSVDDDFAPPTVFELLGQDAFTATIHMFARRGASTRIDSTRARSTASWVAGQFRQVDRIAAFRIEEIAKRAERRGRWPDLLIVYFLGPDEIGHRLGPESDQYRDAVFNVDEQIGRVCRALLGAGILERSYLIFISDHGMVEIRRHIPLKDVLQERCGSLIGGLADTSSDDEGAIPAARTILINGGFRRVELHLQTAKTQTDPNDAELSRESLALRIVQHAGLANLEGVALAAIRTGPDEVWIANEHGSATLTRESRDGVGVYRYSPHNGDPLEYGNISDSPGTVERQLDAQEWLAATASAKFPDLPPQLVSYFDSGRAGDILLFAADDWAFSAKNQGGHGSVVAEDMSVPFIIAGPGIARRSSIPYARSVDLTPTILDLAGRRDPWKLASPPDGVSLKSRIVPKSGLTP
jgi:hypothetical protein